MSVELGQGRERITAAGASKDEWGLRGSHLVVLQESASFAFPLPERGRVVVGRSDECDLRLDTPGASRRHAVIEVAEGRLSVSDLGSRNGTLIGGVRIDAARSLQTGDIVTVGEAALIVHLAPVCRSRAGAPSDCDAPSCVEIGDRSMVVADPAMRELLALVRRLAPTDLPVLIQGETGAGKENAAYALHCWSSRQPRPFIAINCAAFTESLVESELFGAEKGAFSGAVSARPGLFEAAEGGTLFFDEIGELPRELQPKLLRVLESKRAMRVGGTRERELDIRVVAATNRDLRAEVKAGRFREDLLFRLNAATLLVPPLRARQGEIAVLARTFLADACHRLGAAPRAFSDASMRRLCRHAWPGNVRELKNVVEFLAATTTDPVIEPRGPLEEQLASGAESAETVPAVPFTSIADEIRNLEQRRMREALEAARGVQTRAADLIRMPLRTFQLKSKQFGLGRSLKD